MYRLKHAQQTRDVHSLLGQIRRWPNINSTMTERMMFAAVQAVSAAHLPYSKARLLEVADFGLRLREAWPCCREDGAAWLCGALWYILMPPTHVSCASHISGTTNRSG